MSLCLLTPTLVISGVPGAPHERLGSAAAGSLEKVGAIPVEDVPDMDQNRATVQPSPLAVDEVNNLGFAWGRNPQVGDPVASRDRGVFLYDLANLELLDLKFAGHFTNPEAAFTWAIDGEHQRIFAPPGIPPSPTTFICDTTGTQTIPVIRYSQDEHGRWKLAARPGFPNELPPPQNPAGQANLPCPNGLWFIVEAASLGQDPETGTGKLYLLGSYDADVGTRGLAEFGPGPDTRDNDGQTMLVRQIDLAKLDEDPAAALDWEVDLRYAGCGRLPLHFIGRTGDSVVSYCSDPTPGEHPNPTGEQGYVVRIDLDENDQPKLVRPRDQEGKEIACSVDAPDKVGGPPPNPEVTVPKDPLLEEVESQDVCRIPDPLNPEYGIVNAAVRRLPALSGRAQAFLDPETGRVMLLTQGEPNGNAVWVYDAFAERFIGVMTHGQAEATAGKNGAGFDLSRGRAYLFSPNGVLVGPARQNPPLAALRYQILDADNDHMHGTRIAVVPSLRRLIFPMINQGYVALRDDVADPPEKTDPDPDYLTTQIPEVEGKTIANTSGAAQAAGLHVVVPGGPVRIAQQADPACARQSLDTGFDFTNDIADQVLGAANERTFLGGKCIWELLAQAGNREFSLGQSQAVAGTSTGVSATGEPFVFASDDEASDHDVKSAGECEATRLADITTRVVDNFGPDGEQMKEEIQKFFGPEDPKDPNAGGYQKACTGTHDAQQGFEEGGGDRLYEEGVAPPPDLRTGTAGRDGRGFPAPKAYCAVSSRSASDRQALGERDEADAGVFRSQAFCDRDLLMGSARSDSVGVALPPGNQPLISVGSVWSRTSSQRSPVDGTVTTAIAGAQDVSIGPLGIEIIQSVATTRAHGHTGTAQADLKRFWCNITVNGEPVIAGCVNPDSPQVKQFVDQLNQSVPRVQFSVPAANGEEGDGEGTPGGYQAVVFKDEPVQAADATVNDDTSQTVPALQAVVYNDGAEGRSRVIAQFAGVRAEARYGIIPLPSFTIPDPPEFMPTDFGPTLVPGTPGTPGVFVPATADEYGFVIRGARAEEIALTTANDGRRRLPGGPLAALGGALKWLVENPREFALLFAMWLVLGIPVYQTVRRRSFEQALLE